MIASINRVSQSLYEYDAIVHWSPLKPADRRWGDRQCLYAYLAPKTPEILYIGKSWGVTVRGRWHHYAKGHFWTDLERERRMLSHRVIHGEIVLPPGKRLSRELLSDIESLLICGIKPWGNIQSRNSRTSRPGYIVACRGSWPHRSRMFLDAG